MSSTVVSEMLKHYELNSVYDRKNAIKEILQEIVLCGLSRGGFFDKAAFYGGTALRMFYGLDRFSEDLDFSLIRPDENFSLESYFPALKREINSFGFDVSIKEKKKTVTTPVKSAFVKANTREHLLLFFDNTTAEISPHNEVMKIKLELDTNPPDCATFQQEFRLLPAPYEINLYDEPSLFAGKIHAVICRAWKSRVKGRDLYDYAFYISRGSKVNLPHLMARLFQSDVQNVSSLQEVKKLLSERFSSIDYKQAKEDVIPFIKDTSALTLWSADFFNEITNNLCAV